MARTHHTTTTTSPRLRTFILWAPYVAIAVANIIRGFILLQDGDTLDAWITLGGTAAALLLVAILVLLALVIRRRAKRAPRTATTRRRASL